MADAYDESWIYHSTSKPEMLLELDESESTHLVRVLRLVEGTTCTVTDGRGSVYTAQLESAHPKRARLRCFSEVTYFDPPRHSLAQAILKNRGLEDVVELCTQVPVRHIQPLWTRRVQVPRGRELDHQIARLRSKAIAGLQQSKQAWLCEILPPREWEEWLEWTGAIGEPVLVCHPTESPAPDQREGWIAIGPEGGFAPEEIDSALARGSQILSLGQTRLRAVAAGFWALGRRSS